LGNNNIEQIKHNYEVLLYEEKAHNNNLLYEKSKAISSLKKDNVDLN
jgi:hypothetical protein